MPAKPTPGIVERHSRSCSPRGGRACTCTPSFEAWVWSQRDARKISRRFSGEGAKAAAKGWRRDAAGPAASGKLRVPKATTVEQAALEWIAKAKAGEILKPDGARYKPGVLRQYDADLTQHVLPVLGVRRLSELQRRDVQQLVDRLVGTGLSGSRVRGIVMPLRAVCRRAIRNDDVTVNPTQNLELPAAAGTRDRVASAEEAAALLAVLGDDDRTLWATAVHAGLRRGELRALRCENVDTDTRVIHVVHGWDDIEGEIEPKSKKGVRRVPMTSELRRLLLEHMARTGRRGSDLVFGRTARLPFTPTHIGKRAAGAWAAAAVGAFLRREPLEVELDPIGLHECRHTYVSLMCDAGFSLERIGDYVGHSSSYMTDRYRHLIEGHEQEAADIMDAYLAKRTGAQSGAQPRLAAVTPHG